MREAEASPPSSGHAQDLPMGPVRVGRYRVFQPIASGGMATVYLGWLDADEAIVRPVAIKVMHAFGGGSERMISMMLSEARIASRIRHANVVPVVDVVSQERGPALILEYVCGESLSQLVETVHYAIPFPIVARIVVDALEGLHAAHGVKNEAGLPLEVVHRDVSPQNILVDDSGVARIVDFGVAKALERAYTTESGEVRGKLAYMSPEQMNGHAVDLRTDVWAVGMVLWQLLAGTKPFAGLEAAQTMRRVLSGEISPPELHRPCPAELSEICMRALSFSADDRYPSARAMALAVEKAFKPASSREVAQWLRRAAGDKLEKKVTALAEMEQLALKERRARAKKASDAKSAAPVTVRLPDVTAELPAMQPPSGDAHTRTEALARPVSVSLAPPPARRGPWIALLGAFSIAVVAVLGYGVHRARGSSAVLAAASSATPAPAASAAGGTTAAAHAPAPAVTLVSLPALAARPADAPVARPGRDLRHGGTQRPPPRPQPASTAAAPQAATAAPVGTDPLRLQERN